MSLLEVEQAIRKELYTDEKLSAPGYCRYAAEKMMRIAQEANISEPRAHLSFLVYPEAMPTEDVHYAIGAVNPEDPQDKLVFNPVPTELFPQYIGPKPPYFMFAEMVKVDEVV